MVLVTMTVVLSTRQFMFQEVDLVDYAGLWEEYKEMCHRKNFILQIPGTWTFFSTRTCDSIEWINPEQKKVKIHSRSTLIDAQFTEVEKDE